MCHKSTKLTLLRFLKKKKNSFKGSICKSQTYNGPYLFFYFFGGLILSIYLNQQKELRWVIKFFLIGQWDIINSQS